MLCLWHTPLREICELREGGEPAGAGADASGVLRSGSSGSAAAVDAGGSWRRSSTRVPVGIGPGGSPGTHCVQGAAPDRAAGLEAAGGEARVEAGCVGVGGHVVAVQSDDSWEMMYMCGSRAGVCLQVM